MIGKALSIYTNIAWNYHGARFATESRDSIADYLDYAVKNRDRLRKLKELAKILGVNGDVEPTDAEWVPVTKSETNGSHAAR